jgi:hypothetical protein
MNRNPWTAEPGVGFFGFLILLGFCSAPFYGLGCTDWVSLFLGLILSGVILSIGAGFFRRQRIREMRQAIWGDPEND